MYKRKYSSLISTVLFCVVDWKLILFNFIYLFLYVLHLYYIFYFNYFIKLLGAFDTWKNHAIDEVVVDLAYASTILAISFFINFPPYFNIYIKSISMADTINLN